MLLYPEEKSFMSATNDLMMYKIFVEGAYLKEIGSLEYRLKQGLISLDDHNIGCDRALQEYDRQLSPAESKYDKAMDLIRSWKKERKALK